MTPSTKTQARPFAKLMDARPRLLKGFGAAFILFVSLSAASMLTHAQSTQSNASSKPTPKLVTKVSSAYECTQVTLDDANSELLTKEERLALLDQSLSDSINSYTSCVNTVQDAMSGGGSGSGQGGTSGSGSASASGQQSQTNESSGSESPQQSQAGSEPTETSNTQQNPVERGVVAPKDNDSIICKLLFDEIQKSSGASRTGLEKQYKDYMCGQ
jgi:hypothetical protein